MTRLFISTSLLSLVGCAVEEPVPQLAPATAETDVEALDVEGPTSIAVDGHDITLTVADPAGTEVVSVYSPTEMDLSAFDGQTLRVQVAPEDLLGRAVVITDADGLVYAAQHELAFGDGLLEASVDLSPWLEADFLRLDQIIGHEDDASATTEYFDVRIASADVSLRPGERTSTGNGFTVALASAYKKKPNEAVRCVYADTVVSWEIARGETAEEVEALDVSSAELSPTLQCR